MMVVVIKVDIWDRSSSFTNKTVAVLTIIKKHLFKTSLNFKIIKTKLQYLNKFMTFNIPLNNKLVLC